MDDVAETSGCTGTRSTKKGKKMAATEYDVLIIGSGASGGMAAYTLAQKGVKCLMLDAGPQVDFQRNRGMKAVYELPYRGFGKPGRLPHVFPGKRVQRQPMGRRRASPVHARPERALQLGTCSDAWRQIDLLGADVLPPERL